MNVMFQHHLPYSFFGDSSSTMLFGSFHASATYLVWLPRANTSPLLLLNLIDVYANVLPTARSLASQIAQDSNWKDKGWSQHTLITRDLRLDQIANLASR